MAFSLYSLLSTLSLSLKVAQNILSQSATKPKSAKNPDPKLSKTDENVEN
jgi:hypothetical protein